MLKVLQEPFVIRSTAVAECWSGWREIESATFFCKHSVLAEINTLAGFTRGNVSQRAWDTDEVWVKWSSGASRKCRGYPLMNVSLQLVEWSSGFVFVLEDIPSKKVMTYAVWMTSWLEFLISVPLLGYSVAYWLAPQLCSRVRIPMGSSGFRTSFPLWKRFHSHQRYLLKNATGVTRTIKLNWEL